MIILTINLEEIVMMSDNFWSKLADLKADIEIYMYKQMRTKNIKSLNDKPIELVENENGVRSLQYDGTYVRTMSVEQLLELLTQMEEKPEPI